MFPGGAVEKALSEAAFFTYTSHQPPQFVHRGGALSVRRDMDGLRLRRRRDQQVPVPRQPAGIPPTKRRDFALPTVEVRPVAIRIYGDVATFYYWIHAFYLDHNNQLDSWSEKRLYVYQRRGDRWNLIGGMTVPDEE